MRARVGMRCHPERAVGAEGSSPPSARGAVEERRARTRPGKIPRRPAFAGLARDDIYRLRARSAAVATARFTSTFARLRRYAADAWISLGGSMSFSAATRAASAIALA